MPLLDITVKNLDYYLMLYHPLRQGVKEAALIGVPHDKCGETVAAFVVLEEGAKLTEAEIIDFSKTQLASYKTPTTVIFIDELLRNALGKVQKTVLKELYGNYLNNNEIVSIPSELSKIPHGYTV